MSKFCFMSDFNPFVQSKWKERAAKFNENLKKQAQKKEASDE